MRNTDMALFANVAARTAAPSGGGGSLIIEEVGGTDASLLRGSAPNSVNTPGNLWDVNNNPNSAFRSGGGIMVNELADRAHVDTGETNMVVSADFDLNGSVDAGAEAYIYARHNGNNFSTIDTFSVLLRPNRSSSRWQLYRHDGAVLGVLLDSVDTALNNPVTATLTVNGNQISAEVTDGTTTVTLGPVTDAAYATNTFAGMRFVTAEPVIMNNFTVETV